MEEDTVNCHDGVAYISLDNSHSYIMFCGSMTNARYGTKPIWINVGNILDISRISFIPNKIDLGQLKIADYKKECTLSAMIPSKNSVIFHFHKTDQEEDIIGFTIRPNELIRIAKIVLHYHLYNIIYVT